MTEFEKAVCYENNEPAFSYVDVLSLSVARTSNNLFSAEPTDWSFVVREGQEMLAGCSPKLLDRVKFVTWKDRIASGEIDVFLGIMRHLGAKDLLNSSWKIMVQDEVKEDIIAKNCLRLAGHEDNIAILANLFDEKLAR